MDNNRVAGGGGIHVSAEDMLEEEEDVYEGRHEDASQLQFGESALYHCHQHCWSHMNILVVAAAFDNQTLFLSNSEVAVLLEQFQERGDDTRFSEYVFLCCAHKSFCMLSLCIAFYVCLFFFFFFVVVVVVVAGWQCIQGITRVLSTIWGKCRNEDSGVDRGVTKVSCPYLFVYKHIRIIHPCYLTSYILSFFIVCCISSLQALVFRRTDRRGNGRMEALHPFEVSPNTLCFLCCVISIIAPLYLRIMICS